MAETNKEENFSLYIHLYFDEDVSLDIVENLQTRDLMYYLRVMPIC